MRRTHLKSAICRANVERDAALVLVRVPVPVFCLCLALISAAMPTAASAERVSPEQVKALQAKIDDLEHSLISARQTEASIDDELGKLRKLLKLQQLEIQVSQSELSDMENKLKESEDKRTTLNEELAKRKKKLREQLSQLPAMAYSNPLSNMNAAAGAMAAMRLGIIDKLVHHNRAEIQELKKLQDEVEGVNEKLKEEKIRIGAHVEDLQEKQAVLSLNQQVASSKLSKNRKSQAQGLREFHEAKVSEHQLEAMMSSFGGNPAEQSAIPVSSAAAAEAAPKRGVVAVREREINFFDRKGELLLPVTGAVINEFGKKYDPKTNLYTFHKGIEIASKPASEVRAVFSGKVVFSGRLGGYRQLLIIDHGKQFYSLVGNLGETLRKVGDIVHEGDPVGKSSLDETPLYFEIRQRHIAVNPVPWFRDLKVLARNYAH